MFFGLRTFRPSRGFIFQKNSGLRVIFQGRLTMTTGEDAAERLEKRAVEAEETIAVLNSQLLFLKKAAGRIML